MRATRQDRVDGLVGYTGFVGGNLAAQHAFAASFNRANIAEIVGCGFDKLVVSAVPATMWLANNDPRADRANIMALFENLRRAKARKLILISTIAVFRDTSGGANEDSADYETQLAYGRHRREFEELVACAFPDHLILRLPALFGPGLKKNFLFDLANPVPSFLKPDLYNRLRDGAPLGDRALLGAAFAWDATAGMWVFDRNRFGAGCDAARVREICAAAGISALAFTNADSLFQFYDLRRLWRDIDWALGGGVPLFNLATEPVTAGDIHEQLTGHSMTHRSAGVVRQDMRTRHTAAFGRSDGYIAGRDEVLAAIGDFLDVPA